MWNATNSGTFSLAYNDGTFSAQGSFDSAGNFGEIGFERNGSFVEDERSAAGLSTHVRGAAKLPATPVPRYPAQNWGNVALAQNAGGAQEPLNGPKFRGKIPIRDLIH